MEDVTGPGSSHSPPSSAPASAAWEEEEGQPCPASWVWGEWEVAGGAWAGLEELSSFPEGQPHSLGWVAGWQPEEKGGQHSCFKTQVQH